ncbi:hypothetical protein COHA_004110 [Chlorella ohadii]|uniref:Glycosyltransferase 61 catalytic domain-containing protein n=1 Tax=Chlorella ohadii TaxID=2649997 RepID=A0AAD5H7F3_9CHLO|nr:hypothetical protein COHA_004110 [Chlorella ohadii]
MPGLRSADIGTQVRCAPAYCVFRNLFYRGGRFYFVQDPASPTQLGFPWQLGRNRQGTTLSVADAAEFAASVQARVVPGETVLLDWVFFMHPTALGHWLEALMPLFRQVRGVLAATLGVMPGQPLPPLLFEREVASPTEQAQQLLEGAAPDEWLVFDQARGEEGVLWPKDMFTGGNRGCRDGSDARLMRALLHAMHGTKLPPAGAAPPATITLQRKSANRRILNEGEVVDMLREFGEVRVVEFDSSSSLREQLEMVASTGVFVSVHTSNLANALFLPPGAAVVEILQRNWAWEDIDQFFVSLTKQLEDVHHFALRAQGANETLHTEPRLGAGVTEAALPWPQLLSYAPPISQAQGAQQQQRGQVRLANRLFDSGKPENMPDAASVWAYMRHL